VVDYVNGSSATYYFLRLDNGSLIPLVEPPPAYLVGTGERVEAELVFTEVGVGARVLAPREPTQAIPRQPVSGSLLVTLVAAKFADVSAEPYNMSYVHDVVFGPFPSMRHFWESASGGAVVIRPYYIHWGWVTLPRTKADYCNTGNDFSQIAIDVINILYSRGGQATLIFIPNYCPLRCAAVRLGRWAWHYPLLELRHAIWHHLACGVANILLRQLYSTGGGCAGFRPRVRP